MKKPLSWLFVVFLFAGFAQAAWYYPQLPHEIAVHFGAGGAPNRWSSPASYFAISLGIMLLIFVLAIWAPMTKAMDSSRRRFFHPRIPNREYWLANERRHTTIAWLESAYSVMFSFSMALILIVNQLVMSANLGEPVALNTGSLWLLLLIYFALIAIWLLRFLLRFRKPSS